MTAALWNEQITNNMQFMGAAHDHSGDAGDGVTLTVVPSGLIGMFDAACPAGWTQVSAWNNKMIRGAASYGGTGGADTHTHAGPSHTHGIVAHGHAASSHTHTGPSHTHAQNDGGDEDEYNQTEIVASGTSGATMRTYQTGGAYSWPKMGSGAAADGTGASGSHSADVDDAAAATSGAATGTSASGSTLPAYVGAVFCKKN